MTRCWECLLFLSAISWQPPVGARAASSDVRAVLIAAADSVLASEPSRVLYAADAVTADALRPAARRLGRQIVPTSGEVFCENGARTRRVVGTVVALAVERVVGDRATARWSATCLMIPRGATVPASFGETGTYEVVRRGGRWRVARALTRFSF